MSSTEKQGRHWLLTVDTSTVKSHEHHDISGYWQVNCLSEMKKSNVHTNNVSLKQKLDESQVGVSLAPNFMKHWFYPTMTTELCPGWFPCSLFSKGETVVHLLSFTPWPMVLISLLVNGLITSICTMGMMYCHHQLRVSWHRDMETISELMGLSPVFCGFPSLRNEELW